MFKNINITDYNLKEIGVDKLVQEAVKVKYKNEELKILQTIIKEQQKELETYKKIAEFLAKEYRFVEEGWKFSNIEEVLEWARKEVEKYD